jgi:hypothetical protein
MSVTFLSMEIPIIEAVCSNGIVFPPLEHGDRKFESHSGCDCSSACRPCDGLIGLVAGEDDSHTEGVLFHVVQPTFFHGRGDEFTLGLRACDRLSLLLNLRPPRFKA